VLKPVLESAGWDMELPLGSKLEVDTITFSTGGGACNAAVTFARQGLDSAFMGRLGHDPAGEAIVKDLRREAVATDLISYSHQYQTGYSMILLAPNGERTILTYRGASTDFETATLPLQRAHADWFYVTSLAGNIGAWQAIIAEAKARHIKIAANPGEKELEQADRWRELLGDIELLSLNKPEMQRLFPGDSPTDLARAASWQVHYVVVTDGPHGAAACDGRDLCWAGIYDDVPVIDRTGAGDAFASGFVSVIARGGSLQEALRLASANSTSVVTQIGAKSGLIRAGQSLHEMTINCEPRG